MIGPNINHKQLPQINRLHPDSSNVIDITKSFYKDGEYKQPFFLADDLISSSLDTSDFYILSRNVANFYDESMMNALLWDSIFYQKILQIKMEEYKAIQLFAKFSLEISMWYDTYKRTRNEIRTSDNSDKNSRHYKEFFKSLTQQYIRLYSKSIAAYTHMPTLNRLLHSTFCYLRATSKNKDIIKKITILCREMQTTYNQPYYLSTTAGKFTSKCIKAQVLIKLWFYDILGHQTVTTAWLEQDRDKRIKFFSHTLFVTIYKAIRLDLDSRGLTMNISRSAA